MNRELETASFSYSAIGNKRDKNQDYIVTSDENNVYIIADGMGGLNQGKLASRIAANMMFDSGCSASNL